MSIYGTTFSVGEIDPMPEDPPGVVLWRGVGGRNDWPIDADHYERLSVSGAAIPAWCVPGHQHHEDPDTKCDCDGYATPGPWYRLGIYAETAAGPEPVEALLDEDAVRAIRDDLTAWLNRPKARLG